MEASRTFGRQSSSRKPLGRRGPIFLGVVALHLLIIIIVVLSKNSMEPKKKQGALTVFALASAPNPPAVEIPDPVVPIKILDPVNPVEEKEIVASPEEAYAEQQSAEGDPDGDICSPLDEVTAQLASDPLVPLAISRVAKSDRSISEAIVMWNAEWSVTAAAADAPLAEVRSRVVAILQALPPECLALPVTGPRLVAIPEEGFTTFLAFGSGEWSWQQLVMPDDDENVAEDNSWTWADLIAGEIERPDSE